MAGTASRRQRPSPHHDTFAGALVVAGLFTVVPGRIMHNVIFGS
jgi:uncharacterized membrane protein